MKQYGAQVATSFSKKQINVIYMNAKNGNLKVEKWFINRLYDLADFFGFDDNKSVEFDEGLVKDILEAVFAGDFEKAQKEIVSTADMWYSRLGNKNKAKCDRSVFVA